MRGHALYSYDSYTDQVDWSEGFLLASASSNRQ